MMKQLSEKIRREAMRWHLLQIADVARPVGIYTEAMLPIIQSVYADSTENELRRNLDYLEERELVKVKKDPTDRWFVELTRTGIEVVEYTIDCQPGIARPIHHASRG